MEFIEAYRQADKAQGLANLIKTQVQADRKYRLMEFCGGHTHVIHRYGLSHLLPDNIDMIHGPGCPVCVLPIKRIDSAIYLAGLDDVILCTYADMMRVPGSNQHSLLKAKAQGSDVRMLYSVDSALDIARDNPDKQVVFFAIGFETTTPATADAIIRAKGLGLANFSVFCNHVLTPVAMSALLEHNKQTTALDGFVGPAHVSIVIGADAYRNVADYYKKPIVIAGFEPLDMLQAISWLVDMVNKGEQGVKNQYTRAVTAVGNQKAQELIADVFEIRDSFAWRGLGEIAHSGLAIKSKWQQYDAEARFAIPEFVSHEHKACRCADVLCGEIKPRDCSLFAKACTPQNPLGACMVSSEGACAASYAYDVTG